MNEIIDKLKGKLIVSCQAQQGEPLRVDGYMAKMALAAKLGGAVAIRCESPKDIKSISEEVDLPLIGLWKIHDPKSEVFITPTLEAIKAVKEAGAHIVAIDATKRINSNGEMAYTLISKAKKEMDVLIMADISTLDEGIMAEKLGADLISTTLSGYTNYTNHIKGIDFELIENLSKTVKIPVIAEGRIHYPEDAKKVIELGAFAVVVGGAITRPAEITGRFVKCINS